VTTSGVLQKRIRRLEESGADAGDGCKRCRGLLVVVSNAITGELHAASWNGEALRGDELLERETEAKCPKCGVRIDYGATPVIRVGGLGSDRR
jgi:hypothetical protein